MAQGRWARIGAVAGLALLLGGTSRAELRIELHDGRVVVLPFERHEVRRMAFDGVEVDPDADVPAVRLDREAAEGSETERDPALAAVEPAEAKKRPRGRILRVGPGQLFALPSQAAAAGRDGDTIEISAGTCRDVAIWRASRLTIRGVGGRPRIDAGGSGAAGKATWVIAGRKVLVENVELTGSRVPDKNGAQTVIAWNTIVRPLEGSVAVANRGSGPVRLINNPIVGPGRLAEGGVSVESGLEVQRCPFADPGRGDYRPAPGSPAVDAALPTRPWRKLRLDPIWQYRHPLNLEPRRPTGRGFDLGAFEAGG